MTISPDSNKNLAKTFKISVELNSKRTLKKVKLVVDKQGALNLFYFATGE
jgi:hypothetical protein